jgi:hypothetical protein
MDTKHPMTVSVDPNGRGAWDVAQLDGPRHITCETLEAARKIAHLSAASQRPCELIVHDAYHRVIQREIIDRGRGPSDV